MSASDVSAPSRWDKVLIIDKPLTPLWLKEALLSILFARLNVDCVSFISLPLACARAVGKNTALVVELGHDESSVVPVSHGRAMTSYFCSTTRAGRTMDTTIQDLLLDMEVSHGLIEKIKSSCFTLRPSGAVEALPPPDTESLSIQFEDETISIPPELMHSVTESLFQDDVDARGLAECVLECILRLPLDVRKEMVQNVVLCGGLATIPGLGPMLNERIRSILSAEKLTTTREPLDRSVRRTASVSDRFTFRYQTLRHLQPAIRILTADDPDTSFPTTADCLAWCGGSMISVSADSAAPEITSDMWRQRFESSEMASAGSPLILGPTTTVTNSTQEA